MMSYCVSSPKGVAGLALRLSFGLSLLLVGLTHYMTFSSYQAMVSEDLGALTMLGTIWSYVLPALMIVGGALFVIGMLPEVAAWTAGLALASIPVGLLLKPVLSGVPLTELTMTVVAQTFIWLLVFTFALKKWMCCGGSCETKA